MSSLDRPLPSSLPVRDARDAYLAENGFTVAAYEDAFTYGTFFGLPVVLPNTEQHRWSIMLHDLHHVATGYGTDLVGEAEISAWEIHESYAALGVYVGSIVAGGVLMGALLAPRRTLEAWQLGKSMRSLHALFRDVRTPAERREKYEELLELTVGELRDRMGVPADGLVGARRLHTKAPKAPPAPAPVPC